MKTYYTRRKTNKTLDGVIQSIVLETINFNELICEEDIMSRLRPLCRKQDEACPDFKALNNILNNLVADGFIYELNGFRIERFLRTL